MKIGITLNDVLRDFSSQMVYVYNKYMQTNIDLEKTPMGEWDLVKFFGFSNTKQLNDFLYTDCSLEVFGHADQTQENIMVKLNNFIYDIDDYGNHEIILISREANKSIPATLFFLSKLGFAGYKIIFVKNYEDMWDHVDMLVTANPIAIDSVPEDKKVVKVTTTYNTKNKADYVLKSITDLLNDDGVDKLDEIIWLTTGSTSKRT